MYAPYENECSICSYSDASITFFGDYTTSVDRSVALQFSYSGFLNYKRYESLIQRFGTLKEAKNHVSVQLLQQLGCTKQYAAEALGRWNAFNLQTYQQQLTQKSVQFVTIADDLYPSALRSIADPPLYLYIRGNPYVLGGATVSIVGTRAMSNAGKRLVHHFVPPLVQAGLTTVSGLAYGIDAQVAKCTLEQAGTTVAVLASGLNSITPAGNFALGQQIIQSGGTLVSEYPLDMAPQKYMFPARNRIVAGLSKATIVLEAAKGSGALITARLAFEYNREVFAVPGDIFTPAMYGCNELIATQIAQLAQGPEPILAYFNRSTTVKQSPAFIPIKGLQSKIFNALNTVPQSVESLSENLAITVPKITAELTVLELSNVVQNVGGGMWVKV